jgi:hypothetical protein
VGDDTDELAVFTGCETMSFEINGLVWTLVTSFMGLMMLGTGGLGVF